MTARLSAAVLLAASAVLIARAQEPKQEPKPAGDNPYKNVKVGDFATYKLKVKAGTVELDVVTTQTVTAKTDKEVTVKVTATVNGMDAPATEQKIDLTKPFDPTRLDNGAWTVVVTTTGSDGGVGRPTTGLIVDGYFKPGRYSITYRDLHERVCRQQRHKLKSHHDAGRKPRVEASSLGCTVVGVGSPDSVSRGMRASSFFDSVFHGWVHLSTLHDDLP